MSQRHSEAQSAEILRKLEDENGLMKLRLRGYSPWRLIRFPVALALQNLGYQSNYPAKIDLIFACLRSLKDLIQLPRDCRYIVKSYSSAQRIRNELGYEDQYFEELLQNFPGGVRLHSLNTHGFERNEPAWKGPQIDVTLILVIGNLLAHLFPVSEDDGIFDTISIAVSSKLPKSYFSKNRLRRIFSSFWWQSLLYSWLLNRLSAQTVIVADTGERSLLKAAKENQCFFIELQHGVYTLNHPDALTDNFNLNESDPALLLPDIVATYGKYWTNIHSDSLLGKSGRIREAGASFMQRMRERKKTIQSVDLLRLLVTTQGIARKELIVLLQDFLKIHEDNIILNIKLHPAYDTSVEEYTSKFGHDKRVHIIAGNVDPDTYHLLAECDLHLSISSSCHYDAIGLRVPTVVLGLPSYELVSELVEVGDAVIVKTGVELANLVKYRTWKPIAEEVADKYYSSGFTQAFSAWIK